MLSIASQVWYSRLDEPSQAFNGLSGASRPSPCDQSEVYGDLAYVTEMRQCARSVPLYQRAYEGYAKCSAAESRGASDRAGVWAGALMKLGRRRKPTHDGNGHAYLEDSDMAMAVVQVHLLDSSSCSRTAKPA